MSQIDIKHVPKQRGRGPWSPTL